MTMPEEEEFYVREFLARMPGLRYVGQRKPPDADFVIADGVGELSLEITRVFSDQRGSGKGSKLRTDESYRSSYLESTARVYYANGGLPVRVRLTNGKLPHKNQKTQLAKALAEGRPPVPGDRRTLEFESATYELLAMPPERAGYSWWMAIEDNVALVGPLPRAELEHRIIAKAAKLAAYRRSASRVALLLYANTMRGSGMLEWQGEVPPLPSHGFDAVYLYLHGEGKAWRLA